MAISSYLTPEVKEIADGVVSKRGLKLLPIELHKIAQKRLVFLLHAEFEDLLNFRSLHFEKLRGDRAGQWSIRINRQYRICFRWIDNSAHHVEIVDYH